MAGRVDRSKDVLEQARPSAQPTPEAVNGSARCPSARPGAEHDTKPGEPVDVTELVVAVAEIVLDVTAGRLARRHVETARSEASWPVPVAADCQFATSCANSVGDDCASIARIAHPHTCVCVSWLSAVTGLSFRHTETNSTGPREARTGRARRGRLGDRGRSGHGPRSARPASSDKRA